MHKKALTLLSMLILFSMLVASCAPQEVVKTVVVEKVVTEVVEVAGTPQIKEVEKQVIVTATPEPKKMKLEIFHWWTGPG
jgi:ABC-type Fe3+-citrate transport system substrate-binding protein